MYLVFIDYGKCYDKINRLFIWQTLLAEGISLKKHKALKAIYRVVKSSVKYNENISNNINSQLGVKQGDLSSSLLFMMFVNDILANINPEFEGIFTIDGVKLFLLAYADDQVLLSTSPTTLQIMLNDIELYCNAGGLKININKTKILIFEKKNGITS